MTKLALKKITLATVKKFIKENREKLFIRVSATFSGFTDGAEMVGEGFLPIEYTPDNNAMNMKIKGAWFVGESRDHFTYHTEDGYEGVKVQNSCGIFYLAIQASAADKFKNIMSGSWTGEEVQPQQLPGGSDYEGQSVLVIGGGPVFTPDQIKRLKSKVITLEPGAKTTFISWDNGRVIQEDIDLMKEVPPCENYARKPYSPSDRQALAMVTSNDGINFHYSGPLYVSNLNDGPTLRVAVKYYREKFHSLDKVKDAEAYADAVKKCAAYLDKFYDLKSKS